MVFKIGCPHNMVTGGIELLHQVAAELNKYDGVTAHMLYVADLSERKIPDDYLMYGNTVSNQIDQGDIILFPEIWANLTNVPAIKDYRKLIYWESIDNYFPHNEKAGWFRFGPNTLHISQSEYSTRFMTEVAGVAADDIIEITDYVNDDYLNCDISGDREPVVLYNPVKGMEFTEKIIQLADGITFRPIEGMTRSEILSLMKRSMVWIDFGSFPGKDRLPREAGACGMCLITGKRGTAKYHKDLPIPDDYKIDNMTYADLRTVIDKITDIIGHFGEHQKQFDGFRQRLKQERDLFTAGIDQLVKRYTDEV